jgi:transcriptional regulator with XRE-family HTH domain
MSARHDLHRLTRREGTARIAEILGVSERTVQEKRRGFIPLTVDDLFELRRAFPSFDAIGTIDRIGERRVDEGWSLKARREEASS